MKTLKPYLITWSDATFNSGWKHLDTYKELDNTVQSIGWLVKETKYLYCLALSKSPDGTIADIIEIPKGWIKNKRRIWVP